MGNETVKQASRYRMKTHEPKKNFSIDAGQKTIKDNLRKSLYLVDDKPPSTQRNRKISLNSTPYDDSILKYLDEPKETKSPQAKNNRILNNQTVSMDSNSLTPSLHPSRMGKRGGQQKDRILTNLSRKNQQLRRQLKQINEKLTEKLKKKKLIPKKKKDDEEEEESQQQKKQQTAKTAGLKRELQNGYKQIDMYKRTLQQLNAKEEVKVTHTKVKQIQNQVSELDRIINQTSKKIDGLKNIKKNQEKILGHDINQDLIDNLEELRRQENEIKAKMKEIKKRDQKREENYKRQQAYLFEVQKKYRQLSGQYFPDLKKKPAQSGKQNPKKSSTFTTSGKKSSNQEQYPSSYEVNTTINDLNELRAKHEQYHKKIDAHLQIKNKAIEQVQKLDQDINSKQKIIESLKLKLQEIRKIIRPNKNSLFGYDSYQGDQLQSNYGGVSEAEKEIEQQHQQDQFDIKHLIANIPKPIRLKPVEMEINNSIRNIASGGSGGSIASGMIITGQKSQPKVWGNSLTRKEEKGKFYQNELTFDDNEQFQNNQVQPLIIGINGWVNKNGEILGLQAIYLNGGEIRYGIKSSAAADGFIVRYDLQAPDYLKNIIGGFGENGVLEYIAFHSKNGKSGNFGNKRDSQQSFTFGLANNERPFRFNGATIMLDNEPRLCRIGIQICVQ